MKSRRISSGRNRRRGSATVEFALLAVFQLFLFMVVIQFAIICIADSINTYSSFIAARAQAVDMSPMAAAAFWNARTYSAPAWKLPPSISGGGDTATSRQTIPLEMPWVSDAMSWDRLLTLQASTSVYREDRSDAGDNATFDGY